MTRRESEVHRLMAASWVVDVVARHVTDLAPIPPDELQDWLMSLSLPPGWRIGHLDGDIQPSRIAVYGEPRPHGGWDASDTINIFRFTGDSPDAR